MARKAMVEKAKRPPKFSTRALNRCKICGRQRGYMGFFAMCRICVRKFALEGLLPGVRKASW